VTLQTHPRWFEPVHPLGRTGFLATMLGIGDLADRNVTETDCVATLRRALDAGLNVIDTAPAYEDGYSERLVGLALKGRRQGVFVIDKIDHMDRPVTPQVEESLLRLDLDEVDLFVFHGVSRVSDWRALFALGGGMDQLDGCVRDGKVRFKGVSSHHPAVVREAIESGRCDVVMFAVGPFADQRYVDELLPLARARGVGTVCFKTFGAGKLVGDTEGYGRALGRRSTAGPLPSLSAEECVRYTLTAGPDVALLGLSSPSEQDAAFRAAMAFEPLDAAGLADIRRRAAAAAAGKGPCWWNPEPGT
jgi:aryl-alcohol dehydrogenase-like predicted oxidoreductase